MTAPKLPELPEPYYPEKALLPDRAEQDYYTKADLHDYARAAVGASQPKAEAVEDAPANLGEFVIALLIAGGYVTEAKVTEARKIALSHGPYEMPPESGGQGEATTEGKVRSIVTNIFTDDFGSLTVMLPSNDWTTGSMVRVTLVSLPKRAALSQGGKP